MELYAVIWFMEYEGEQLLGIFSDYVKAREYMLKEVDAENVHIRKVELDRVYGFGEDVGEAI